MSTKPLRWRVRIFIRGVLRVEKPYFTEADARNAAARVERGSDLWTRTEVVRS